MTRNGGRFARASAATLAAVGLGAGLAFHVWAAEGRKVGDWFVEVSKDPFSPKKKSIVLTGGSEGILAVRCFPDEGLSVLVMAKSQGDYEKDAVISFKYRADEGPITDDHASVFGPKAAILPNARQVLQDAQKASTIYIRIDTPDGTATDLDFKLRGASKALAQVVADCPADEGKGSESKSEENAK